MERRYFRPRPGLTSRSGNELYVQAIYPRGMVKHVRPVGDQDHSDMNLELFC